MSLSPSFVGPQSKFSIDLGKFLSEVWQKKGTILDYGPIYDMYKGPGSAPRFNPSKLLDLKIFLGGLNILCKSEGKKVDIQELPVTFDTVISLVVNGVGNKDQILKACGKNWTYDDLLADLWDEFYHVLSDSFAPEGVKKRVYIHVAAPLDLNTVRVMQVLVPRLDVDKGFQEVKTVGPGGTTQLDSIVAYCDDDDAVQKVLTALRDAGLQCLKEGLPKIVQPVQGLQGVGVADEPPDVQITGKFNKDAFKKGITNPEGHSFGTFLAKLTWMALEEPKKTNKANDFVENMLLLFQICKIDPKQPHLHPQAQDLQMLQAMWTSRVSKLPRYK